MRVESKHIIILIALCYVCLMFGNGIVSITNPDETFYAQTAREMVQHKTWMTPYLFDQPQFEKPILLYWLLRVAFLIFGVSSFSIRFFPAVFASLGVLAVYYLTLLAFKDSKKAFISGLVLASSGLYIGLSRAVFTDMIFSVFILFSLLSFYWGYCYKTKKGLGLLLFFVFSGLSVLTKGPIGFLISVITVSTFLLIKKDLKFLNSKYTWWGFLAFCVISLPWYILMFAKYGNSFTHEFFYNDHYRRLLEAEHVKYDTWYFYPLSLIEGFFPWSILMAVSLIYFVRRVLKNPSSIYLFLACWIAAVLLVFQPAHSKLVSYILPLYPAIAIITGDFIHNITQPENKGRIFFVVSLVMLIIMLLLPVAIFIASIKFQGYIPSRAPVYFAICGILVLAVLFSYSLFKRKFSRVILLQSFLIPMMLSVMFFVHDAADPYFSSEKACEFLMKNYDVGDAPILCAKMQARGVRYFTDKKVAILNIAGTVLFSPHPIPFLNNDEKATEFFKKYPVFYGILQRSSMADITRLAQEHGLKVSLLKTIGASFIVKIEHNA